MQIFFPNDIRTASARSSFDLAVQRVFSGGSAVAAGLLVVLVAGSAPEHVAAATLHGVVHDERGRPIAKVEIARCDAASPGTVVESTTTDARGQFSFPNVVAGSHSISAAKRGWVSVREETVVPESAAAQPPFVLVMQPTPFYRIADRLRLGILVYVLVLGLLTLVANYWIAPQPSREINIVGWGFVAVSVATACAKQEWLQAFLLACLGVACGAFIHRFGNSAAKRRKEDSSRQKAEQEAQQRDENDRLQAYVGKEGTTLTALKPFGNAEIEGQIVEVKARHGFIPEKTCVVVRAVDGKTPVVETG